MTLFRPSLFAIALFMVSLLLNANTLANRAFAVATVPSISIAHTDDEPSCNDADGDGECDTEPTHD